MERWAGWAKALFGQFECSITGKIVRPGWFILLLMGLLVLCARTAPAKICGGAYTAVALVMAVRGTREQYGLTVNHRDWIAVGEGLLLLCAHVLFIVEGAVTNNRTALALGVVLTAATAFVLFVFFVLRWDDGKHTPK